MARTVAGVFANRDAAERAVQELKRAGFDERQVSLAGKDERARQGGGAGPGGDQGGAGWGDQNLSNGTGWGAGVGAGVGLAASLGAMAIPGIGPLVAMGPLAATLGGAAAGGIAGGLLDMGIPEGEGRRYEEEVRRGRFLAVVEDSRRADEAAQILRRQGAQEVRTF
ncbi:MAG: hypothetical protein QJR14_02750 [Bacillota bacterium]|nr:hypothetical protein [Bacillota bacterium]